MRAILFEGAAKRWSLGVALLAGVAALLMASRQGLRRSNLQPPHWFWGNDADSYAGSEVKASTRTEPRSAQEETARLAVMDWYVRSAATTLPRSRSNRDHSSGDRETSYMDVDRRRL